MWNMRTREIAHKHLAYYKAVLWDNSFNFCSAPVIRGRYRKYRNLLGEAFERQIMYILLRKSPQRFQYFPYGLEFNEHDIHSIFSKYYRFLQWDAMGSLSFYQNRKCSVQQNLNLTLSNDSSWPLLYKKMIGFLIRAKENDNQKSCKLSIGFEFHEVLLMNSHHQ